MAYGMESGETGENASNSGDVCMCLDTPDDEYANVSLNFSRRNNLEMKEMGVNPKVNGSGSPSLSLSESSVIERSQQVMTHNSKRGVEFQQKCLESPGET